jgi:soluble lytic murein transglycosylase-like protein
MNALSAQLAALQAAIEARQGADPSTSYTAQLLADPARAAKKLGEEAVELAIAAAQGTGTPSPPRAPTSSTTGWSCWPPAASSLTPSPRASPHVRVAPVWRRRPAVLGVRPILTAPLLSATKALGL